MQLASYFKLSLLYLFVMIFCIFTACNLSDPNAPQPNQPQRKSRLSKTNAQDISSCDYLILYIDSPYYYSTPSQNEWRVYLKFQLQCAPGAQINCIDWEIYLSGTWQSYQNIDTQRLAPDGNLG